MSGKAKLNFWIDVTIFVVFLVTAVTGLLLWLAVPHGPNPQAITFWGLARHRWVRVHAGFGMVTLIGAVVHIALHWKWIKAVSRRSSKDLAKRVRLNWTLDKLLFVAFILANVSGFAAQSMSKRGVRATLSQAWSQLHLWTGLAMTVITVVHLSLHWKWIVSAVQRYVKADIGNRQQRREQIPA